MKSFKTIFTQAADWMHFMWVYLSFQISAFTQYVAPQIKHFVSVVADPVFLLSAGTGVGFISVLRHRSDLTIDLALAVFIAFWLMSFLGVAKHIKEGTANGKEFLKKTIIQWIVSVSVISLGYIIAVVTNVGFKVVTGVVTDSNTGASMVTSVALYWIFAGYAIVLTYYVVKIGEFINVLIPQYLPNWFTSGFSKFRETGKVKDILGNGDNSN